MIIKNNNRALTYGKRVVGKRRKENEKLSARGLLARLEEQDKSSEKRGERRLSKIVAVCEYNHKANNSPRNKLGWNNELLHKAHLGS
jgi:hypothetical protein